MMKLIGNLLLVICVTLGALTAATSYLVRTSAPDSVFEAGEADGEARYLTLASGAGAIERTPEDEAALRAQYEAGAISAEALQRRLGARDPVVAAGEPLNAENLVKLRDAEVTYVRVKEFSFARWPFWWLFLIAAAFLGVGSLLVRAGLKKEIAEAAAARASGASNAASPEQAMASIRQIVAGLLRDLPGMSDDTARNEAIVERIGEAQVSHVPNFVEARVNLVGRLGLAGYAALMDRFAGAERQINRAWSAAADGVYDEAIVCLERSEPLWAEAEAKLNA